jgi:hypothetical protein
MRVMISKSYVHLFRYLIGPLDITLETEYSVVIEMTVSQFYRVKKDLTKMGLDPHEIMTYSEITPITI